MPAKKQSSHEFGQRLTELRLAPGLTQVQLAASLGVSQRAISRLETVSEYPTVPRLVALCEVLQTSADELSGLKPPPKVVASLPERDQRAVLRIIDSTAKARRGA